LAVYNHWHKNRKALADTVRAIVISEVENVVYPPVMTTWLGFDDNMYALSLYALLKDAGFNIAFAIVDTQWDKPCTPMEVAPVVRFSNAYKAHQLLSRVVDEVGVKISYKTFCTRGWMNYCDDLYVLIDTYNLHGGPRLRGADRGFIRGGAHADPPSQLAEEARAEGPPAFFLPAGFGAAQRRVRRWGLDGEGEYLLAALVHRHGSPLKHGVASVAGGGVYA
jgi:hypothetical protein